jgi:hypothetical protein
MGNETQKDMSISIVLREDLTLLMNNPVNKKFVGPIITTNFYKSLVVYANFYCEG